MKKNIIYIGILALGFLLGWFLFGNSSKENQKITNSETLETHQMWTCSMHPQIIQPEPGDCPICGMDLIPAETGVDGLTANQFKLTPNAMALANIQTTIVGNENIEDSTIKLSGKIVENEGANVVQASYFSGRIERLNISFTGEKVHKGKLLATIYSPELYAAQQELITAATLKESQPALYKAVRTKLKLWKLSDIQISEIETTGKVIENFPVYATVTGTVTEKLVEQGDYIKQGQPLLKIANLHSVWANFDVYENQINLLKKGQEVLVTTNAYPTKEFKGVVDFIDPILNTKTRTVTSRVVLNNENELLKPGMFVSAKIGGIKNNSNKVLTIPASAILWTGERSVIYLKTNTNEPVFEMRKVTLGNQIGNYYEVMDGLNEGDEIVTNGTFTIDAAAQLQGKNSMMQLKSEETITENSSLKNTKQSNINMRLETPKAFQEQLKKAYESYILLKNALVKDNSKIASENANNLLENLNSIEMQLLNHEAHKQWMPLENEIKSSTNAIANTTEIKVQRDYFKQLSAYFINAVQLFGVSEKVYVEFCPMADNNKGAYWLSNEEEILNPYFGNAMLKCGEVKQVID